MVDMCCVHNVLERSSHEYDDNYSKKKKKRGDGERMYPSPIPITPMIETAVMDESSVISVDRDLIIYLTQSGYNGRPDLPDLSPQVRLSSVCRTKVIIHLSANLLATNTPEFVG